MSQPQQQIQELDLDQRVSQIVRIPYEVLRGYLDDIKSQILQEIQKNPSIPKWVYRFLDRLIPVIGLVTLKPYEVMPVTDAKSFVNSVLNQIRISMIALQVSVDEELKKCDNVFAEVSRGRRDEDLLKRYDECMDLYDGSAHVLALGSMYILELVNRVAQFSLPISLMPNTVKGVGGFWSD